jgi:hypothetical protein
MVDRPRPGDPAGEPSEAALRMLVDALTAPGTPHELSRESAYLEAFRALSTGATARISAARRRRRLRLAAAGGVAALALTGTAAALTGTYPGATPAPGTRSQPAPAPTASGTPGSSRTGAPVPATPMTATGTGGTGTRSATPTPTASPPATLPGSPRGSVPAKPSATTPPASPSPKASPTTGALPPVPVLRNYCKQYQRGKVPEGSRRWQVLALAAGAPERIAAFCEELLDDDD